MQARYPCSGCGRLSRINAVSLAVLGPIAAASMRQAHPAGERMFVDYAGQTVDLIDGSTGEIRPAQIFVAVMGASNYTYAEATLTQTLPDWIGAHIRALAFMGGVPAQLVPDNPRVGVDRANWYEPGLNRTSRPGHPLPHRHPADARP